MKYDFTVAHIACEVGGTMAIYSGDKFMFSGNGYHNNVLSSIESFICGVMFTGVEVNKQDIYISDEYVDECDCECPDSLLVLEEKWPNWKY